VVLASGRVNPTGLDRDAVFAYWTDLEDTTLHKIPLAGGEEKPS
jgi:hypothetical protein